MTRTVAAITRSMIAKLTPGWALGKRDGILDSILGGIALALYDVEMGAEALMDETDPRKANRLLTDFERCLGPDPCGRDSGSLNVAQRQQLAHQRWTARGGQSIPYFVQLAARLGVSITIDEFWPSRAGGLRAGQRLQPEGCQFVWRVNIPGLVTVVNFRAGASRAGDSLGSFAVSSIECEIRRLKPAHTVVVFSYGGS
jgi:uncharacterized protein YmfQ (DUF2313 family)